MHNVYGQSYLVPVAGGRWQVFRGISRESLGNRSVGNPKSRALYDVELLTLRHDTATAEDVSLEDLTVQDSDRSCSKSRDGDTVSLLTSKSLPTSVVLPCGSCSLKVRLLINGDTRLRRGVHL
ncbi:hypothetical protein CQW23_25663 [Capsicum baccatum]|uniref:Uncharacterized protein n=1 Tax=Capsicum baccatum TaxID=33114 RepID=A0A2G2VLM5_CAPBA|nr:hypothetical protein CQW23_25663 [Capsicum baccatum]